MPDNEQLMPPQLTIRQIALIRHCVGFDGRNKTTFRNHFVLGADCDDYADWLDLVARGLAFRRGPREISGGMDTFWVTREAALAVRNKDEHLARDFRE